MAAVASLRIDLRAECGVKSLSKKTLGFPISVVAAGPVSIKHAVCRQMWGSVTPSFFL